MLCPPPLPPTSDAASRSAVARSTPAATVHVCLQVLRGQLVRLDPIPILDERLERLRGGALFEESDRQDGAELASARRIELADGHLGIDPGRAQEFRGGLRPSGE